MPAVGKAAAPATSRVTTTRAPAKATRPPKRKNAAPIPQPSLAAARDETTPPAAEKSTLTPGETTVPAVGN
eukprot:3360248-Pleurochrysis_carterae.AAC.1